MRPGQRLLSFGIVNDLRPTATGTLPPPRPTAPTRRHFWSSAQTVASAQDIWEIWTDLTAWPDFDPALRSVSLADGGARIEAVGQAGTLVDETGRSIAWRVTHVAPQSSYTFTSKLIFAELHVHRSLVEGPTGGIQITHEVWFAGPLGRGFAALLGGRFRSLLPGVVARVVELAEARTQSS